MRMLRTQFDLISCPLFNSDFVWSMFRQKSFWEKGRFSEEERTEAFKYLNVIISTRKTLNLCLRAVKWCLAALMYLRAQPEVEPSHGTFSVLNGGKRVLGDRPPHPSSFTSTLSCSLTNHREKESAGGQGINVYVGEVVSSRSTCFEVSFSVCVWKYQDSLFFFFCRF